MTVLEHACARCGRPMRHDSALICAADAAYLRRQLELVAKIAGDITLTVAKLSRVTRGGSGRVDDLGWWKNPEALEPVPLPVDLEAAQRHDEAVNVLNTWARLIIEERGQGSIPTVIMFGGEPGPITPVRHPLRKTALLLVANLEWLRHHPAADEAWLDLLTACGQLVRVVDTNVDDRPIIGLCVCRTARHDGEEKCRRCGETALSADRAQLDAAQHGYHVTASEAAVWIADMGLVTDTGKLRDLIYKWRDRGYLTPVDDTPRYRFGDVLTRVMASPALRVA